jgi:hypothetical protein
MSFLVQWPLIVVAFLHGLKVVYDGALVSYLFQIDSLLVVIGAMVISALVFAWVYALACKNKLWHFGYVLCFSLFFWLFLQLIPCLSDKVSVVL